MENMRAGSAITHFVVATDSPPDGKALSVVLAMAGTVEIVHLGAQRAVGRRPSYLVVDIDLTSARSIQNLRPLLRVASAANVPRIFLTDEGHRQGEVQARALGATQLLTKPLAAQRLLETFRSGMAAGFKATLDSLEHRALATGVKAAHDVLERIFEETPAGNVIRAAEVELAEEILINSINQNGLRKWLEAVKLHHSTSYRHSLFVTGTAISFAQFLGIGRADQRRFAQAALVHDVGKALIPLSILDKPGRLSEAEQSTIKTHPRIGYDLLKRSGDFSDETLDVVLHHHELIDGTGYPDSLKGSEIKDIVRIITICDIFSALVEERAYKPSYEKKEALEIMRKMGSKLDEDILSAFNRMIAHD